MSQAKRVYQFFGDPGHGWLKVSMVELIRLGIIDKVTSYSYKRNGFAYLEEDCDLALFCRAKDARGEEVEFKPSYSDRDSRIRRYEHFGR